MDVVENKTLFLQMGGFCFWKEDVFLRGRRIQTRGAGKEARGGVRFRARGAWRRSGSAPSQAAVRGEDSEGQGGAPIGSITELPSFFPKS